MAIHEMFIYLCVQNAAEALDFYARAFGAREKFRLSEAGGRIGHAEMEFDGATLMLSGEFPSTASRRRPPSAAAGHHPSTCRRRLRGGRAGGKSGRQHRVAPTDQFYGERSGILRDPFGHRWNIGHSIEEVSPEEMQKRYDDMVASGGG